MNTESKVRAIAIYLINVQTFGGVVEVMNQIAVSLDGYSDNVLSYFKGLYEYIDSNDSTFKPLTDEQLRKVQNIGARLLIGNEDIVSAFVRLHHMLAWDEGEEAMVKLSDRLYSIEDGITD